VLEADEILYVGADRESFNLVGRKLAHLMAELDHLGRGMGEQGFFEGELLTYLRSVTAKRFATDTSPAGWHWPALNEDYRAWKEKRGYSTEILEMTEELLKALTSNTEHSIVEIANRSEQSSVGGAMVRTPVTTLSYGVTFEDGRATENQEGDPDKNLPARPFLGLNQGNVQEIRAMLIRRMEAALRAA
jgi:phage gpG-like protein